MGSCISKCKPKMMIKQHPSCNLDLNNLVHDKLLIIPQSPLTNPPCNSLSLDLSNKISPYPPSPSPSTSSLSSFTCLSSATTLSSASTATSRSAPFSDDYLWSCYKQNPHVARINSLKANALSSPGRALRLNSPVKPVSPVFRHRPRQPSPQRVSRSTSTPLKRVRPCSPSPSPTPPRQKSFRKEQRPPSPSPTRRVAPAKGNSYLHSPAPMKKEISCIHRISSKIDEVAAREAASEDIQDFDTVVAMEDIDNPLISLDCFIFL